MQRYRIGSALVLFVLTTVGCQSRIDNSSNPSGPQMKMVRLHFDGFTKSKSGATWMAWPDAVNEALSGLEGVRSVEMKLESDEFLVSYDASKTDEPEILKTCEASGFGATIATGSHPKTTPPQTGKEQGFTPPEFYTQALTEAKQGNKPIVLDFMATWCAPCKRISDETFVEKDVAALLERCILLKIDTDEHPGIAKHFKVSGLPDIRFLTPDGKEIKQLLNFQEAAPFAEELSALLKTVN